MPLFSAPSLLFWICHFHTIVYLYLVLIHPRRQLRPSAALMMGGEVGAGAQGGIRVGFDGHGGDVGGAHEGPAQGFNAVIDVRAEYVRGNVKPWGRFGVRGVIRVLANHVLLFLIFRVSVRRPPKGRERLKKGII